MAMLSACLSRCSGMDPIKQVHCFYSNNFACIVNVIRNTLISL